MHHHQQDKKIPSSLLILSRAFTISERIPRDPADSASGAAQALQATLSSLPEHVVNEAALEVAQADGTATAKLRLEVIKDQEELIDDELEQEEEVCVCVCVVFMCASGAAGAECAP